MPSLGRTGLDVFPICLGGNVFGWTADEAESFEVLDAYVAAGGNFIDTANSYLVEHGRSETIIGRWMADRGNRDELVIATKVGGGKGAVRSLRATTIEREAQASLKRLQTDRIDLYYAHFDDEQTPLGESLAAFDALVQDGTVRAIGASNYSPGRLTEALELQQQRGLAPWTALQPHYNLVERDFERALLPLADAWDLAVVPYYGLAKGFLTGKYRGKQGRLQAGRGRGRLPRRARQGGARGARRGRRRARGARRRGRARLAARAPARGGADRQRAHRRAARAAAPGGRAGAHRRGAGPAVGDHALASGP